MKEFQDRLKEVKLPSKQQKKKELWDIDKGAEVMYNMMKNLEAGGEVSEESQGLEGARKMFQTSQRLGEVL